MPDFIAIDFETANQHLNSACAIGISIVEDLKIVDRFSSYIRPVEMEFDERNISIHGITPEMVKSAPTFIELWEKIKGVFSPHVPVVAHNARFDLSVLKLSAPQDIPNLLYVDSIDIVKPLVSGSKSLSSCVNALNLSLNHHHDAGDDSEACAEIAKYVKSV